MMRKTAFANGEFYHVYNRGTDKRNIFSDKYDIGRFLESMKEFNALEPIGSIYEHSFQTSRLEKLGSLASKFEKNRKVNKKGRLVDFVCYCLNPNHYHFLLRQASEKGIEKFLHRLGTGYTKYFNNKYKRTGALFQGTFKATHVDLNEHLLDLSIYINLNDRVHQLGSLASKLVRSRSSFEEYKTKEKIGFCEKGIILGQFKNPKEYEELARNSLVEIIERRKQEKEIDNIFLE